jgi:hypothetical protein
MIVDCHAHVVAPDSLYAFRALLLTSAGHFDPPFVIDEPGLAKAAAATRTLGPIVAAPLFAVITSVLAHGTANRTGSLSYVEYRA